MSDVDVNAGDGEDGEADAGKRRLSGKKLVLLYILPTLLLLAAGGAAGAYFFPCLSGYHPHPLYVVCLLGLQARAGAGALRRRSG